MVRVLVTGGAGFIGTHLVRRLLDTGHAVEVMDDLSAGGRGSVDPRATFTRTSVLDGEAVKRAIAEADVCVHLAAVASVRRCNEELLESHRTNLDGFLTIVDAIRSSKRDVLLVYASSAAVYGNSTELPLTETAFTRPLSPYGADKFANELHAIAAAEVYGVRSVGFRFFNVYGPGQDPNSPYSGVISRFASRVQSGEAITIFGDGQQTRDFVFVEDVVDALVAAATKPTTGAKVFNVCTGVRTSIAELATTMQDAFGSSVPVTLAAAMPGDVRHSCGNPRALETEFGRRPQTSLRAGLDKLVATLMA